MNNKKSVLKPSLTSPFPSPPPTGIGCNVTSGAPISKLARLRVMSADEWEDFINEWVSGALKTSHGYSDIHRCGGAGDMGRDVIAFKAGLDGPYDNYQCKHYDHPLYPSDIWLELAKLCYWTFKGEYVLPDKYTFVAPQGFGTSALKLLGKPNEMRAALLDDWDKNCAKAITSKESIVLSDALKAHIEAIDFKIFTVASPTAIIEEHSKTCYHTVRFGGGLPARQDEVGPSPSIGSNESRYVAQLLEAYGEHGNCQFGCVDDLATANKDYGDHLKYSREDFFSAECLGKFSRDYLPPDSFGELQQEIEDAVREIVSEQHETGFHKVKATTKYAKSVPIQGHPLRESMKVRDKAGICHQLANEDRIIWVRKEANG